LRYDDLINRDFQLKFLQYLTTNELLTFGCTSHPIRRLCIPYAYKQALIELNQCGNQKNYLHQAAELGLHSPLASLLALGASANTRNWLNETPLHFATRRGCFESIDVLVQSGADVDALSRHAWAPILLAARYGNLQTVKKLVSLGADVNVVGFHGWTPLHMASRHGYNEIFFFLHSAGAGLNAPDSDGILPQESSRRTKCWGAP
jgi:ankyrin repeat protein